MKRYDRSNWFYCHIICLQAFKNGFIFEVVDFEHNNNEIILNIFNMFRCKNNSGKFTHSLRPIPTIQLHELQLIHERVFLLIVLVQLWCRSNILYNIFMILSIDEMKFFMLNGTVMAKTSYIIIRSSVGLIRWLFWSNWSQHYTFLKRTKIINHSMQAGIL